jgi:GNAT superfamily N-acetyltransferase
VTPARWYRSFVPRGLVWVATEGDVPFGFAFAEPFEDALHLWELDAQRQGAGRALVMAVAADARARNLPAVTLTTFRDIPWNTPFYTRLGFVEVPQAGANPRLAGLRAHEAALGLDVANRWIMRLAL